MIWDNQYIKPLLERYLAGKLTPEEEIILWEVLEKNPAAFDEMLSDDMPAINPESIRYPHKSRLFKSYSDLSDEQFEHMCIASSEGDLSSLQSAELEDYAMADEKRRAVLNTYKHLHLRPEPVYFSRKRKLKRTTTAGKIIRLAGATLSAAASVAIIMLALRQPTDNDPSLSALSNNIPSETETSAVSDTNFQQSAAAQEQKSLPAIVGVTYVAANDIPADKPLTESGNILTVEEPGLNIERVAISPVSGFPAAIRVAGIYSEPALAEVSFTGPVEFNGPLSLKDHLAIAFREKLLGEEIPDASPLKAYEIAEAGISGINRLLGWEMDLNVSKEQQGEVNALAFNSRLIKFQAPVRKNVTSQ